MFIKCMSNLFGFVPSWVGKLDVQAVVRTNHGPKGTITTIVDHQSTCPHATPPDVRPLHFDVTVLGYFSWYIPNVLLKHLACARCRRMGRFRFRWRNLFWVFSRDGMGKCFRLLTAGWEWDGKVGSHLVDGTGRDYTISWWDRTGRDRETRR